MTKELPGSEPFVVAPTSMTAAAEAWSHANHVRMWISQAQNDLGLATPNNGLGFFGKLLSRGRSTAAHSDAAIDALEKARYAMMELEHWLARAGVDVPRLHALDKRFLARSENVEARANGVTVGFKINSNMIARKREVLGEDLQRLDALIAELDRRQRS